MLRKTFFIAIVVALLFLVYRGINPSGADKLVNKISSVREKTIKIQEIKSKTGSLNATNSGINTSGDNSYEKILQSGTMIELTGKNEKPNLTGNASTGNNTNTGAKTTVKTTAKTSSTVKPIQTNTNGLSQQDYNDLKNLLDNIVE